MKYFLIAGEASGDLHASNLMASIKSLDENAEFRFFGGDLMLAQGGSLIKHYRELAYMGIIPVVMHLRAILQNMRFCKKYIKDYSPDAVILVDYPGFNLKMAKYVKSKLNIPVYYYISPKVWAWKEYRVKQFKKYVDEMFCILPFEVNFFKKHNYPVTYVGNPILDAIANRDKKDEPFESFITENNLENKPIIALLAGSRKAEIINNLPAMIEAAKVFSEYQLVVAGAPGIAPDYYDSFNNQNTFSVVREQTYRLLSHSRAALVTSGTATLETALLNVPQVVCYKTRTPKLYYWIFKNFMHTPFISLVNLISEREVVKELFTKFFSVDNLREELNRLLKDSQYRQQMLHEYDNLHKIMGKPGASARAGQDIYEDLVKRTKKTA